MKNNPTIEEDKRFLEGFPDLVLNERKSQKNLFDFVSLRDKLFHEYTETNKRLRGNWVFKRNYLKCLLEQYKKRLSNYEAITQLLERETRNKRDKKSVFYLKPVNPNS